MRDLVFDFQVPRERVSRCISAKSTLISGSVVTLRERGHFERYSALLDAQARDQILYMPAGVWQPIAIAEAHYGACDRLGLSAEEVLVMGNAVARLTQKSVLALALRLATESGTTPWTVLNQLPKLWTRLYQGAGLSVWKVGPKDAELHIVGQSLAQFAYWRTGVRGIVSAVLAPFAARVYVRELPAPRAADYLTPFRIAWA